MRLPQSMRVRPTSPLKLLVHCLVLSVTVLHLRENTSHAHAAQDCCGNVAAEDIVLVTSLDRRPMAHP
jgi:hypothetical protein